MIRFGLLLLGLWALVHWHGTYQQHQVAKAMSGQEVLRGAGGLVEVTGVVTQVRLRHDGSKLIALDCQGAKVTVYCEPLLSVVLPRAGSSVKVHAKRLQGGLLSLDDPAGIQTISALVQASAGRLVFDASDIRVMGWTRSGKYRRVWFSVDGGGRCTSGLADPECSGLDQAHRLSGYWMPGGQFRIESWQ